MSFVAVRPSPEEHSLPGTDFIIDGFRYRNSAQNQVYFLRFAPSLCLSSGTAAKTH